MPRSSIALKNLAYRAVSQVFAFWKSVIGVAAKKTVNISERYSRKSVHLKLLIVASVNAKSLRMFSPASTKNIPAKFNAVDARWVVACLTPFLTASSLFNHFSCEVIC